jgi:hypothetical protein
MARLRVQALGKSGHFQAGKRLDPAAATTRIVILGAITFRPPTL